jgi:hypothetical protein
MLVTLECTPVDIAMSVIGDGSGVYSPAVLGLWDGLHPEWEPGGRRRTIAVLPGRSSS